MVLAQNDTSRPTESPLRRTIADLQQGAPDAGSMTPELGAAVQAQAAAIAGSLRALGQLQQMEFAGVERGMDVYKVTFANGATQWLIGMSPDGRIAGLFFKPLPVAEARGDDVSTSGLSGTLLRPDGSARPPVVLLIGGSGPTDRNGNQGGMGAGELRQLAEQLAEKGIASLRYDKRGVGRSITPGLQEKDLVLKSFVDDAVAWCDWLRQRPDLGPVVVIGHSEGGLIAMLAARREPVAGIVLLATPGRKLGDIIRGQLQGIGMEAALQSEASNIIAALERGETIPNVSPGLQALFRPSVQPFMISELAVDPAKELGALALPVMIVSGGHDLQISATDAALLSAARPDAVRLDMPEMNHVLKTTPADRAGQQEAYASANVPLAAGLSDAIARFVRQSAH
jgi:pimeloyl-ACP methyl ester carboxylesterase